MLAEQPDELLPDHTCRTENADLDRLVSRDCFHAAPKKQKPAT